MGGYGEYRIAFVKVLQHMKSFIAKPVISIFVNLRYLRLKLLKYKENNKNICGTFDHNLNIYLYISSAARQKGLCSCVHQKHVFRDNRICSV